MSRTLLITLTPQEEADIAGWVGHYAQFPAETPTRLVLSDRSRDRFWQIARQFGIGRAFRIPGTITGICPPPGRAPLDILKERFARGDRAHRNVVFLHRRRRNAVYARRVCQALVFADQTGLGVLGNHETGVHAGIAREERLEA